jgi:predicted nuclease of predicted toxin-antitoxin system
MKFLVDNALSIVVSQGLKKLGYDSIHVKEIGLSAAEDIEMFERGLKENRIIISADTDFGYLLSKWASNRPSIILFRKGSERNPLNQVELLKVNLPGRLQKVLETGSIVIIETTRIRVRELPL